ncbi:hypothetical protein EVAR_75695_1 [Eumeta japonica]|uniref:Uncharacterized protein n=1 Tax=Eumeta variegata TaxID=151549 RepID=A0A4C1W424_EUMVA|nr:hypothetical protein EVAR_75695_1 [Eumeta japonica]
MIPLSMSIPVPLPDPALDSNTSLDTDLVLLLGINELLPVAKSELKSRTRSRSETNCRTETIIRTGVDVKSIALRIITAKKKNNYNGFYAYVFKILPSEGFVDVTRIKTVVTNEITSGTLKPGQNSSRVGCVRPLSLFYSDASADGVEERSLVPRSRSHAQLRRNATLSHPFSSV